MNNEQTTMQKSKDLATRFQLIAGVNSSAPEESPVPASLVTVTDYCF